MRKTEPLGEVTLGETFQLRLTLVIRDLHMKDDRPLVIPVKTPSREVEVRLRRPTEDELTMGREWVPRLTLGDTICVVSGSWRVSDANRDPLTTLAREGGLELTETVVVFGSFSGTGMPAWDALPESLRQLLDAGFHELARAVGRSFRLIRWRMGLQGEHNPFGLLTFAWSPEGTRWQDLPWKRPMRAARFVPELRSTDWLEKEIAKRMAADEDEPISHDLLREASDLVDSNPRGALMIAIAAAEIGFKEFVSRHVPAASWLVTEAPTPPLIQMLTRYLPELLGSIKRVQDLQFVEGKDKKTRAFNDRVLRELDRAIVMRNQSTHKPVPAPDPEDVRPIIGAVQDLLGMLDHYSGFGKHFIRSATHADWFRADAKLPG